jgi:hypothetical protein
MLGVAGVFGGSLFSAMHSLPILHSSSRQTLIVSISATFFRKLVLSLTDLESVFSAAEISGELFHTVVNF